MNGASWILPALVALLSLAPSVARGQAHSDGGPPSSGRTIKVGSEVEFPPYAMLDDKGQATGFSVDLLRAVALSAGLAPEITTGPWDQVWSDLVAGELDVLPIVAVTDERRKLIDFGLPHTETFDAFFVPQGEQPIPDLRAAQGKTIGVMRSDAAHHELVEQGFRGRIELVDTIPEGLAQVAARKYDAFLCSKLVGVLSMQERGIRGVVVGPIIPDYKRVFAFGLRKGSGDLKERLDQGLLIVKASGEYERIHDRWLSYDDPWRRFRPYLPAAFGLLVVGAALAVVAMVAQRRRTRILRSILHTTQDAFWMVGPGGRLLWVNDAACAISGYSREELLEMTPADLEAGDGPAAVQAHLERVALAGADRFLARHRRKDGALIDVEVSVRTVPGMRNRVVAFLRDVTDQRRFEKQLRESEESFRDLFERHAAATLVIDPETGRIVDANQSAADFYGWPREHLRQMRIQEINTLSAAEVEQAISRARASGAMHFEFRHRLADGSIRDVDVFTSSVVVHGKEQLHSTIHDSSARRRSEEALHTATAQLALTRRLAALGTLVSGVAHEINNPLAGGMANQGIALEVVREVRERLDGQSPLDRGAEGRALAGVVEALEEAKESGERIARIVRDLSVFGRPDATRQRGWMMDVVEGAMRWLPATVALSAFIEV